MSFRSSSHTPGPGLRHRWSSARRAQRVVAIGRSRCAGRRAFSLVELIVVMVIIGMLAGLVAIRTRSYLIASKQNATKAEIAIIVKALETFYADQGRYPNNDEGLAVLVQGTSSFPDGFLDKVPVDPWRHEYEYVSPARNAPFEVLSLGADGKEGGEGADRDFTSDNLADRE